jgi:hypothetical protein
MADVYSRNEIAANNSTSGSPVFTTTFGANALKNVISQSDAGRELVISVTKSGSGNLTNDILLAVYRQLTQAGGSGSGNDRDGTDAFTFAGFGTANGSAFVSGTTTVGFFRIQGSGGVPDTTTVDGATIAVVATFTPAL